MLIDYCDHFLLIPFLTCLLLLLLLLLLLFFYTKKLINSFNTLSAYNFCFGLIFFCNSLSTPYDCPDNIFFGFNSSYGWYANSSSYFYSYYYIIYGFFPNTLSLANDYIAFNMSLLLMPSRFVATADIIDFFTK